jgi:hypothetical protein
MAEYVYKVDEDSGKFMITEDGGFHKILEALGISSCLEDMLCIIHQTITAIPIDNWLSVGPQDEEYPWITVSTLGAEWDRYHEVYTFRLTVHAGTATDSISVAEQVELAMEGLDQIPKLSEIGPTYAGDVTKYAVTSEYKYLCGISETVEG